jgi:hypothetical protein
MQPCARQLGHLSDFLKHDTAATGHVDIGHRGSADVDDRLGIAPVNEVLGGNQIEIARVLRRLREHRPTLQRILVWHVGMHFDRRAPRDQLVMHAADVASGAHQELHPETREPLRFSAPRRQDQKRIVMSR